MPRRRLLTSAERAGLLRLPESDDELIRYYTLSDDDLIEIRKRRGDHNRLGYAVQLCYLRYPGYALPTSNDPPDELLVFVARQLQLKPSNWQHYAQRDTTRREHVTALLPYLHLSTFTVSDYRRFVVQLAALAQQTDRGIVLVEAAISMIRDQRIVLPTAEVIERLSSEALTRGTRQLYRKLIAPLEKHHFLALDTLLTLKAGASVSQLIWLRQPPGFPRAKHILTHLARLQAIQEIGLPKSVGSGVHQNRLLKLAREGAQMTAQHLRDLEALRRYASLICVVLDSRATLIDEIIELHERFMNGLFSKAKRNHAGNFLQAGKAINEKVQLFAQIGHALLDARQSGNDPFAAIEAIIPWDQLTVSVEEADKLAQPENFDYLSLISDGFSQLRRYSPTFLGTLRMKSAPATQPLLDGVDTLKSMNDLQARKVPGNAPLAFVRKRWESLVHKPEGIDRKYYELCVMSELKNSLRAGDIWVEGSRQFKDFDEYLLPKPQFTEQQEQDTLNLPVDTDCDAFLEQRLALLNEQLATVEAKAANNELPDALITLTGQLKITPLETDIPDTLTPQIQQVNQLLPRLKITELLLEVDQWTNFTRHFTHLKSDEAADDKQQLLTTILADGINLGLSKMADSCPGSTYAKLSWLHAWYIRDETYSAALAELVNSQTVQPLAAWWGDGTTSSSDGQNFRAGGRGKFGGRVNLKYGTAPGVQFYTHISDQYATYHTNVINSTVRDATHVLDGLLHHESDLRIEEHYTDTAGFTDHVFALMHLLGFKFAPRIRDLADKRLYVPGSAKSYPTLANLIGGKINIKLIRVHWDEILRLAASINQGTVTASLILRKLGSYPRQNSLAVALRELGRIERTLFTLEWLQSIELRRRVQVGLNKGEEKNALARAVFLNRLGEVRDRSFESQRYRASGLNLIVAAIVLWNTVYLDRAVQALRESGTEIDDDVLMHLSPLGWERINLTGDYHWRQSKRVEQGKFRQLRSKQR